MSSSFDRDSIAVKASALREALDRLCMLGLINGASGAASADLMRLIAEAFENGERNQENLILYAIGRFHVQDSADNTSAHKRRDEQYH
jgi:hypothetical protein